MWNKVFFDKDRLKCEMLSGEIKDCGKNLVGMILYTYFDDKYDNVPFEWEIDKDIFMKDYQNKILIDLENNRIYKDNDGYLKIKK
jgi:hypothetical protein